MRAGFETRRIGDRALVISFSSEPSYELTVLLEHLRRSISERFESRESVPGHRTLLVEGDSSALDEVEGQVSHLMTDITSRPAPLHELGVAYGGPDLEWASQHLGLSASEIVRRHAATEYHVKTIGSPGFVYLSPVDPSIALPRMDDPRREVPAGSVGIGGSQTGIYGRARPGGWRIVGSVADIPPLRTGDRIRFLS